MASDDEDEQLQLAIAMSKQDQLITQTSTAPVINLVDSDAETEDEDEDEEFKRAVALSLRDVGGGDASGQREVEGGIGKGKGMGKGLVGKGSDIVMGQKAPADTSTVKKAPTMGLLGFDRKAMEEERLARLGKRKREDEVERPSKMVVRKTSPLRDIASVKGQTAKGLQTPSSSAPDPKSSGEIVQERQNTSSTRYPKGVIKRTWAFKHPRTNDIKIEELIQKDTLKIAVLSSFDFDADWAYEKIDPYKYKQVWIMNAKGKDIQDKWREDALNSGVPNMKIHFPPMSGAIQKMHSKLMLLVHEEYMRIVVPTANWTKYDWGETPRTLDGRMLQGAVMENSVFIVDVPRRKDGEIGKKEDLTLFGKHLLLFLESQELSDNISRGILKFDFSDTNNLGFVHSIGGSHDHPLAKQTGFNSLHHTLTHLNLTKATHLKLDYASSSLGALTPTFLQQLYSAAGGPPLSSSEVLNHWRIYFPSKATVEQSTGGPDCGGTITLNRRYWNAETFPRQCFREYKSTRPGVLSHNKILLARGIGADGKAFAWAYVGSANLSESAWGREKQLKSGKRGKMVCANWECGVVMQVPEERIESMGLGEGEVPPMSVFEGTVEVPFVYPGEEYGGREPWFFWD